MSDVSRGTGWWRAADGYWYPPYTRSGSGPSPGPTPPAGAPAAHRAPVSAQAMSWWHRSETPLALVVAGLVAVALLVAAAGSSSGTPSSPSVHLGQVVYDDGMVFRVAGVACGVTHIGTRYFGATAPPGTQWCIASVGVANTTTTSQGFAAWDQYAVDTSGRNLPADTTAIPYLTGDGNALYADLDPGVVTGVRIPFELPRSGRIAAIELHDTAISPAVTVENTR